jgi:hypothetical protein
VHGGDAITTTNEAKTTKSRTVVGKETREIIPWSLFADFVCFVVAIPLLAGRSLAALLLPLGPQPGMLYRADMDTTIVGHHGRSRGADRFPCQLPLWHRFPEDS